MARKFKIFIGVSLLVLGVVLLAAQLKISTQEAPCKVVWGGVHAVSGKGCDISTNSSGEPALIELHIPANDGSFLNSNLVVKINGSNLTALKGFELRFFANNKSIGTYSLPIFAVPTLNILRDHIDTSLSINWSSLKDKSGALLNAPIDRLELYLVAEKQKNLTLNMSSFQWLSKPKVGRVSFTFDDGYSDHHVAGKILATNGLPATAYLITDALNTPNYLTTEQVLDLKKWGWELGSHLVTPVTELKQEELELQLKNTTTYLKNRGSNGDEKQFAFPLGQYSVRDLKIMPQYLTSARLASGGVESLPPQEKFRLRTVNVTPALSSQELLRMAEEAIANGDWVIFMFHYLDHSEKGDLNYSLNNFSALAKELSRFKDNVKTVGDVLRENKIIQ